MPDATVSKGDKPAKEKKEAEEAAKQAANQAATQESWKVALSKLTKEKLARGEPLFQKTWAKFQEAIDMLPEEEKNKPLKQQQVRPASENVTSSKEGCLLSQWIGKNRTLLPPFFQAQ